jgi:hypothetical protein
MTFLVPEYQPGNRYYFAGNAVYHSSDPIPIPGFDLWVSITALDRLSAPTTVIATESRSATSFFYPISFGDAPTSLSDIFEISEINGQKVFYVPPERFVLESSAQPFLQVPNNDWSSCSSRFQVLAALYRLSIVPSLSPTVFTSHELFDDLCKSFCETYQVSPPVEVALASIFAELVFALDLFGFARPSTLGEANSIEAAFKILNDNPESCGRTFAFGDIEFAITKFNRLAFPDTPADRLTREGYYHLRNLVEFVRSALSSMGLIPDDFFPRKALSEGVVRFQKVNGIPTGPCDPFTLRHIWSAAMPAGCDFTAICRLSGIAVPSSDLPAYTKTLEPIELTEQNELQSVRTVISHIFGSILCHSEGADWLLKQAEKSVESQIERLDEAAKSARAIDDTVSVIDQKLEGIARQNGTAAEKFGETAQVLEDILTEHRAMLTEFSEVQKRVSADQDGNNILLAIVLILSVLVFVNLFK